ncbi:proton-conducting transporter membrane subunit [sulfur-oxidizing endosymbiont of Gigantopelta aegis]|uniref:proton-conducting transporter transmembrane domain-containing protein n=1 Tax=sulfur-oxidizing endosymbiont of Gigantopelta aegis TaxID=2794934 RepID=UPI0018DD3402|nr:proton-conducting transporter membrane subunit [sulfur-oxidizing endosymbiont of Gigantopelta aegis]
MTVLDQLLLFSALSTLVIIGLNRLAWVDKLSPVFYAIALYFLIQMSGLGYGEQSSVSASFQLTVLGETLHWRFDAISWFFALITLISALFAAVYMSGAWGQYYREKTSPAASGTLHIALALNVLAMLILLASGDLLSLFIGWELVSWASFMMMALNPEKSARKAAIKYIIYAMAGAMAFLMAIAMTYTLAGSLEYAQVAKAFVNASNTQIVMLTLLFGLGFGIKMGVIPFHLWQAKAYAETPGGGAIFLGAISARMGLFALVIVIVQLVGLTRLHDIAIPYTFLNLQTTLAWIGALTTIIPTYIALQQNDARHLLAWHGVGQGGYMLLGVMIADNIGSAGGLMHVFNHATYQAALFMTVTAVIYRTGTSDFGKLGGLVTQMPLTFLVMVISIIGLAGLPPMNGFVSKWLIYRSLLLEGQPFLFVAAVIGTLGTILSVYKLVHNTFLGQIRVEHHEVREAPLTMLLPMLGLAIIIFATGMMPGIVLDWVASAQSAIGLTPIAHSLGGINLAAGGLDMLWVTGILFYGLAVGAIIFYVFGGKAKRVHQYDNYAGGHFLTSQVRYHYSHHFYAGLMHLIGGWYRQVFIKLERAMVSLVSFSSQMAENFYRSKQPVMLLAAVMLFALWFVIGGASDSVPNSLVQGGIN